MFLLFLLSFYDYYKNGAKHEEQAKKALEEQTRKEKEKAEEQANKPQTYDKPQAYDMGDAIRNIIQMIVVVVFIYLLGLMIQGIFDSTGSETYSSGSSSGDYSPTTGTLQISADSGANLYVGNGYVGRGTAFLTLNPGSYTVSAYSSSTNELCWRTSTTVYSGKNSVIRNNAWCR